MADVNIFPDEIEFGEAEIEGVWYFGLRAIETAEGATATMWLNSTALKQVIAQIQFLGSRFGPDEPIQ